MSTQVEVKPVSGSYVLGEGPHWDPESKTLYFVDIVNQKVLRYDPATGTVTSAYVEEGPIGFVVPVAGSADKLLVGVGTELRLINWTGEKTVAKATSKVLLGTEDKKNETRWNDAKVDSSGRLWGGTMSREQVDGAFPLNKGSMYSVNSDLELKKQVSPVSISNGLAWSPNDDTLYYIDSLTYQIAAYDYNPRTGSIANRKTVFDFKEKKLEGLPDGMTIDTNGDLWVAVFGGGCILNVRPSTGELLRSVKIPGANNITSVAFGDDDYSTLYVTSATVDLTEEQLKRQPNAGYLFSVKGLGVRGTPPNTFKLNK